MSRRSGFTETTLHRRWDTVTVYVEKGSGYGGSVELYFVCEGIASYSCDSQTADQASARIEGAFITNAIMVRSRVLGPKLQVKVRPDSGQTLYGVKASIYLTR